MMRLARSWKCAASMGLVAFVLGAVPSTAPANHPAPFVSPLAFPPALTASDITLTAQVAPVQIFSGAPTQMWTYNGTFPGPTIRRPTGEITRVKLVNNLPSAAGSITLHNHGNHSEPASDGQPDSFLVPTGGHRTYYYTGLQNGQSERGTLQWYHDHRMDVTARNVWMGLAGLYLLDDPADPQTLPSGAYDIPIALSDRSFDSNNQISYSFQTNGVTGDHILVNGMPQPYLNVGTRKYRFRILNASNFRNYELQLSNGASFTQIGTESGLLPAPVQRQSILITPAERADVVVDFAGAMGQNIILRNADVNTGPLRELMQIRVNQSMIDDSSVPATLRPLENLGTPVLTRTFDFGRSGGQWTINGLPFDPNRVDFQPVLGTTERWILRNSGGWNHTVHVHDVDMRVISRNGSPPSPAELTKDSVDIGGGQEVEVLLRFDDHLGRYVFHCHVLEHEDDEMMGQFEVVAAAPPPPTGFPRPKGATPISVPLVPAYQACDAPNREHAAPLTFGSCGPPEQASDYLTVGTPDANGAPANSTGLLKLQSIVGAAGGTDDSDAEVTLSLSDVRCKAGVSTCGAANAAGGSDYVGELRAELGLRITDKLSGNSRTESATVANNTFPVTVTCSGTAATDIGGTCTVATTLDALLPGTAPEGARSIWELDGVRVLDGGPDGLAYSPGNQVFATQGLFVP
jgi:FtsP/CotA-like multicopper oxidase with cupredoxin domain